eukprot:3351354-Rhodomonas_salina.2
MRVRQTLLGWPLQGQSQVQCQSLQHDIRSPSPRPGPSLSPALSPPPLVTAPPPSDPATERPVRCSLPKNPPLNQCSPSVVASAASFVEQRRGSGVWWSVVEMLHEAHAQAHWQ